MSAVVTDCILLPVLYPVATHGYTSVRCVHDCACKYAVQVATMVYCIKDLFTEYHISGTMSELPYGAVEESSLLDLLKNLWIPTGP